MKTLPRDLRSPVDLPEGAAGEFEIRHSYNKKFDVVSLRESLLTGKAYQTVTLDEPIRIHSLYEKKELWIADVPIEVRQHREAIKRMFPYGHVLVGGLGLGIAASMLAKYPRVTQVDVVEISPRIAKLCAPRLSNVNVIVDDFMYFLERQVHWKWSGAFVDLWRGDSEGTWWDEVFPIRRLIGRKFGKWVAESVFYWAEDIMLGQVGRALMINTEPHWKYVEGLKRPMTMQRARWFLHNIGTPLWERRYGKFYPEEKP